MRFFATKCFFVNFYKHNFTPAIIIRIAKVTDVIKGGSFLSKRAPTIPPATTHITIGIKLENEKTPFIIYVIPLAILIGRMMGIAVA
jgi:hypothetical protein